MSIRNVICEPEVLSTLFLFANLIGIVFIFVFFYSWPLSTFWSCLYISMIILINRRLAAGRSYLPTKNLRGQTVIITGAATGIGRVCALRFAKLGARVIIGIRGQERAESIAKQLCEESHGGEVIGYDLDLSSLANVKLFAEKIDRADILLNNAGVVEKSFLLTVDGIESDFGINHIGHFYLTQLLLPLLTNGRIVNVSSLSHYAVPSTSIDYSFSILKNKFDSLQAYGFSKLAQIYHASELTRRYGIKAYSLHPGTIVDTNLQQRQERSSQLIIQSLIFVCKTVEQGAMTSLYCALSDDAKPGCFHSDCQVKQPSKLALDTRRAEECWNESEKLINEKIK